MDATATPMTPTGYELRFMSLFREGPGPTTSTPGPWSAASSPARPSSRTDAAAGVPAQPR
jgi:hypothetical protein